MSNERLLLDLGKHVSTRVAEMMSQALDILDTDEERMVLVLIAMSRMLQAGGHMIGQCVEEFDDLPPGQRVLSLSIIISQVLDGFVPIGIADRLSAKRMELAMRRVVERTQQYGEHMQEER